MLENKKFMKSFFGSIQQIQVKSKNGFQFVELLKQRQYFYWLIEARQTKLMPINTQC